MFSPIYGLFERLFEIKPREFSRVQTFFLFLTTSSMFATMGAAVGDTLFLARFGSERAERLLPWVYIGIGLLTVALTRLYEHFEEHFQREKFVVGVNVALASSLLVFRWALRSEQLWLYYALVIWLEAVGLLAFLLFFSFTGDYFTSRDARRLYGYINGGIAVGSLAGGYAVEPLVRAFGNENILYICSGLLACGAAWCLLIAAIAKPVGEGESGEEEESKIPLRAVLSDRFLQIVIVLVLASQIFCHLVDYQLKVVASRRLQEEALAIFFGKFYGYLGLAQILVQFLLVGWLLRRFGVVKSLLILPTLLLAATGTFYLHPVFMAAVAANFIHYTFLETLDEPATELLFMPLASRLRVRAQSFVEGIVLPLGICSSGVLLLAFGRFFHDVRQFSLVGIAMGLAWMTAAVVLLPRYREMLSTSLRRLGLDALNLTSTLASAEGIKAVMGLLQGEDPDQQALALDFWESRPLGALAEPVRRLARSANAAVAAKALKALAADKDAGHLPVIEGAERDARGDVRSAAISAHFEVDPRSALPRAERWLQDEDPSVRVAALAGCMSHSERIGGGMAHSRLTELLRSEKIPDRVIAAKVLARFAGRGTSGLVKQLLRDPALDVRREVLAAAAAAPEVEMVPWLVEQLREPSLRPSASEVLERMPLAAVPAFIELIAERMRPIEERSLLCRILGRFGGLRGAKVLWDILSSDEDVMLRVAAVETLLYMKARNPAHDLSRYQDDAFLDRRLQELALINQARQEVGGRDPFFCQVLFDHARLEVKTALFAQALRHEDHQIHRVEASLFAGSEAQKSNALEIIEVIFPHEEAVRMVGLIGPLVEEHVADGPGLRPETIRRLLEAQSWLRAAARHHLDAKGIKLGGDDKMSGQEIHMYKLMAQLSFLKQVRLFEGVSGGYLMSLAKIMQERTFCKGEILFSEGKKADSFYLVREGALRLTVGGREVARRGPRDSVGEMALIEDLPYSATASAAEDVRALRISADEFNNVLLTHPEITVALLRHVSARLRESHAASAQAKG